MHGKCKSSVQSDSIRSSVIGLFGTLNNSTLLRDACLPAFTAWRPGTFTVIFCLLPSSPSNTVRGRLRAARGQKGGSLKNATAMLCRSTGRDKVWQRWTSKENWNTMALLRTYPTSHFHNFGFIVAYVVNWAQTGRKCRICLMWKMRRHGFLLASCHFTHNVALGQASMEPIRLLFLPQDKPLCSLFAACIFSNRDADVQNPKWIRLGRKGKAIIV